MCVCLCVYQRISLTAEPIWFSFTDKLLLILGPWIIFIDLGMIKNYSLHFLLIRAPRGPGLRGEDEAIGLSKKEKKRIILHIYDYG